MSLAIPERILEKIGTPRNRKKQIEEIRDKKEIYESVDSASMEEMKTLHEEIRHLNEMKMKGKSLLG